MCSDKADRSSAIVIEMLYSTSIWETGTVKVFDLIGNIISRVSRELVQLTGRRAKLTGLYIGKGGALNRGLKLIKQLIRVFRCILLRPILQSFEVI